MILFMILMIALLALAAVSALVLLAGGTVFTVVFGDLIVFGLIVWVFVLIFRRRR